MSRAVTVPAQARDNAAINNRLRREKRLDTTQSVRPVPPLSDIIAGWQSDWPQTGSELWNTPSSELSQLARDLRTHLRMAVSGSEQVTFGTPFQVVERLEGRHVEPKWGLWETLMLDKNRQRVMKASHRYGTEATRKVTKRVPTAEEIAEWLPLPQGGCYLLIYWGHPGILHVRDRSGSGVAEDIAKLRIGTPGSPWRDLILWDNEPPAKRGCFYSLTGRCGYSKVDTKDIEFPEPAWVRAALGEITAAEAAASEQE